MPRTDVIKAISLVVALLMLSTAVSAYIEVPVPEPSPEDPLDDIIPPPVDVFDPTVYRNLTFADDFELPSPDIEPVQVLSLELPDPYIPLASYILQQHHLYFVNGTTRVHHGEDIFSVINEHNSTYVRVRDASGGSRVRCTIEYNGDPLLYDDKNPASLAEIEADPGLLNKTGALDIAIGVLKTHRLYNASWEQLRSGTHMTTNVIEGIPRAVEYHFTFNPLVGGRLVYETSAPWCYVNVDPAGEVERIFVVMGELEITGETMLNRFPHPLDLLEHLEHNLSGIRMPPGQPLLIRGLRLGYRFDQEDPCRLIPCWMVLYSNSGILKV